MLRFLIPSRHAYLTQTSAGGGAVHFLYLDYENSGKQRKNSVRSRCFPNPWTADGPGFPREIAMSLADNFVQKQQKQQNTRNYRPAARLRIL